MDSSIPEVTLKRSTSNQSADQGLSSVKKRGKGNGNPAGLIDLIGGPGSFASLLGEKVMGSGLESRCESVRVESTEGSNGMGKASIGSISNGGESFFPKRAVGHVGMETIALGGNISSEKNAKTSSVNSSAMETIALGGNISSEKNAKTFSVNSSAMETIALGGDISSEKNAKTSSVIPSTGEVSEAKTKGRWNPKVSGKTQILKSGETTDEDDAANLPKGSYVQEGEALSSGSVSEQGNRILLKQEIGRLGSSEKTPSGAAKPLDGEADKGSAALSTDGLKGNSLTRKNATDGARGFPGDEMEDQKYRHDQDLSKGSDVKGSSISKVSQNPNGREMLSIKDGNQYSTDVAKDNATSIHQIQTQSEKIENYKNLSAEGLKSQRSLENTVNDIQTGKIDSSLSTGQTDFSMVNGIWNDARTGTNDRIAATVSFKEVAGQIIDGASNMLMKGSSRIVITLEPPNLGTLNMDVRVQHDTVRMLLTAENHEVKQVLQANLDQLKTALQGQGLNIDRFDVLVHDRSYDGNHGFQPGGGTFFDGGRGRRDDTKDDSLLPQMLPSGGKEINEPSLGIISLFV